MVGGWLVGWWVGGGLVGGWVVGWVGGWVVRRQDGGSPCGRAAARPYLAGEVARDRQRNLWCGCDSRDKVIRPFNGLVNGRKDREF